MLHRMAGQCCLGFIKPWVLCLEPAGRRFLFSVLHDPDLSSGISGISVSTKKQESPWGTGGEPCACDGCAVLL